MLFGRHDGLVHLLYAARTENARQGQRDFVPGGIRGDGQHRAFVTQDRFSEAGGDGTDAY